jgi:copper chaperone
MFAKGAMVKTRHTITVENLKCGGCTSAIINRVGAIGSVEAVEVDLDTDSVSFLSLVSAVPLVRKTLQDMGYPEEGTVFGMSSAASSVRSYVSCVIGKLETAS